MTYKLGLLVTLPLLLVACGESSPSSSGSPSSPNTQQTAQYITYYRPESSDSNWFDATWKSETLYKATQGDSTATLTFPNSSPSPDQAQASKKGVLLRTFDGAPMKLTVSQTPNYNISINYMILSDKANELILKGDASSSLKIEDISSSGKLINEGVDFLISRGNMKENSEIQGGFKFEKFKGSKLDNTFIMTGGTIDNYTSSLTIPQDFTLKGFGFINRSLINQGTIEVTTGKMLHIEKFDNTNGSIILHVTKDKGIALLSNNTTTIKDLKITVHSDVDTGNYEIFELPDIGAITPKFTNDAQGNVSYAAGKYSLNLTKKPSVVFFMARNIHSPAYQRAGSFQTPDYMTYLSPNLQLKATQDATHEGTFLDLNFHQKNTSWGIYGYQSPSNYDAGIKIEKKYDMLHHKTIFHTGYYQEQDIRSQFWAVKTNLEVPIKLSGIQILPEIHIAYENVLNVKSQKNINCSKESLITSGFGVTASSKSGGFLSLSVNHGGISEGIAFETGFKINL